MPLQVILLGDESKADSSIRKVIDQAITIVQLSGAPTTAGGQLPTNLQAGFYGGYLYINCFGTVYKFTGTAV